MTSARTAAAMPSAAENTMSMRAPAKHQNACPMLKCSTLARLLPIAAIQLEAEVEADRPDRRTVAHAEPDAAAQLA